MADEFKPSLKPLDDEESGPPISLPVPGFWPRLGAFALDAALLSLFSYLLVKRLYPVLYPHRLSLQWLAMFVVWLYFVIGYSPITKGQTIGKLVLGFRVVNRLDGGNLTYLQMLIRGSLSFVCAFAVTFVIHFFLIQTLPIHATQVSLGSVAGPFVFSGLACAYAFSAAVMAGLHPRKLAIHDILAGTAVVRSDEVERGLGFVNHPGPGDNARIRTAMYPSVVMAVIVIFVFTSFFRQIVDNLNKSLPATQAAQEAFGDLGILHLIAINGPSEKMVAQWKDYERQRSERYTELMQSGQKIEAERYTTKTLGGFYPGEQFNFYFESNVVMSSETLVLHPDYQTMMRRAPDVAASLSAEYFVDEDGNPLPYYAIHTAVYEVLPAFMYTEKMSRHFESIDLKESPFTSPASTSETLGE
jgi:uncharacterized RDD family membrane protein YckC